jgi:hypothetical protein
MGYLENVSWTYTRGGSAQMTLTCSMIRTREMYGQRNGDGQFVYTPVNNAILRWCAPTPTGAAAAASVIGSYATLPVPVVAQQTTMQRNFNTQTALVANVTGDASDVPGNAWVVQNDVGLQATDKDAPDSYFKNAGPAVTVAAFRNKYSGDFFITPRPVDAFYCLAVQTYAMPYTDDSGYILARPFPWGRYSTLEDALDTFTRPLGKPGAPGATHSLLPFETAGGSGVVASTFLKTSTDAFLLTGLGTPSSTPNQAPSVGTTSEGSSILQQLTNLTTLMSDNTTCFVVSYPTSSDPAASGLQPNPFNALQAAATTTTLPGTAEMSPAMAAAYASTMVTPGQAANVAADAAKDPTNAALAAGASGT